MPVVNEYFDKDLYKVFNIEKEIFKLKTKYSFIKKIIYISDGELMGITLDNPRLVHILHDSILRDYLNGFKWEGEFNSFKNDLKIIDNLYNTYDNIELILPIRPNYVMIKYEDEDFAKYKNLYNYSHEDYSYKNKYYIGRINYYIIKLMNRFMLCFKIYI
jgi:hypothetical protein